MSKAHADTSPTRVPPGPGMGLPGVLRALAAGTAVPARELASQLGMTLVEVANEVTALQRAGLEIHAAAGMYQLAWPIEPLDAAAILAAVPRAVRLHVGVLENHWRLDSTSSELARRAAALPDCSFVFADWQLGGRGRRGRKWLAPPAANLQVSCLKHFAGGYPRLTGLSLAIGVAVVRALEACAVAGVRLKWPNDLVWGDAKLGGILVELGGDAKGPSQAIIGVGVNLRLPAAMRTALGRATTDLAELCGDGVPSRGCLAAAVVTQLVLVLEEFDVAGFAAFAHAFAEHDALAGRHIRVQRAGGDFEGVAAGVDARGALSVRTATGLRHVDSADVSVHAV